MRMEHLLTETKLGVCDISCFSFKVQKLLQQVKGIAVTDNYDYFKNVSLGISIEMKRLSKR